MCFVPALTGIRGCYQNKTSSIVTASVRPRCAVWVVNLNLVDNLNFDREKYFALRSSFTAEHSSSTIQVYYEVQIIELVLNGPQRQHAFSGTCPDVRVYDIVVVHHVE